MKNKHLVNKEIITFIEAMRIYGFELQTGTEVTDSDFWQLCDCGGHSTTYYDVRLEQSNDRIKVRVNYSHNNGGTFSEEDMTAEIPIDKISEWLDLHGVLTVNENEALKFLVTSIEWADTKKDTLITLSNDFKHAYQLKLPNINIFKVFHKLLDIYKNETNSLQAIITAYGEYMAEINGEIKFFF